MRTFTITQVEEAINKCREIYPGEQYVLSKEVSSLATVYGAMIAARETEVCFSDDHPLGIVFSNYCHGVQQGSSSADRE